MLGQKRIPSSEGGVEVVAEQLREQGYTVHTHIGSSSCKVDIGIVAPEGEKYALGILLDAQPGLYTVRDREIIMPGVLSAKGWKLYRLHALAWHTNREAVLDEIKLMLA